MNELTTAIAELNSVLVQIQLLQLIGLCMDSPMRSLVIDINAVKAELSEALVLTIRTPVLPPDQRVKVIALLARAKNLLDKWDDRP